MNTPSLPTQPAPLGGAQTPAQLAKAALRRLALDRLEPTPENYLKAYRSEAGEPAAEAPLPPAADAQAWAQLIGRLVKGVERGGRQWTSARKKDSLQRVLAGSRSDPGRLQQRLTQLVAGWDGDTGGDTPALLDEGPTPPAARAEGDGLARTWAQVVADLAQAIAAALPDDDPRCTRLKARLADLLAPLTDQPDDDLADDWRGWAGDARRLAEHRQHLTEQLRGLCSELGASLGDLAEDGSWVQGQSEMMRARLQEGLTARTVRSVSHLLHATRARQGEIKAERARSRDVLKQLINSMVQRIGELGARTGSYHDSMDRYVQVIAQADTLESLAGVVKELVDETRSVQSAVQDTHQQLRSEHAQAEALQTRVRELEAELQRLSAEVSTDPLTEIANRRGLVQSFEVEHARLQRQGGELAVGLLDIDNFKKLNDSLGHQTGDEALKFLANHVKQALRPMDTVARYGGEEFVVLLPQTTTEEASVVLTRLQRTLTAAFFMHDERQVFVTFSAGVTLFRPGERLEETLDRADEALYEAKRTGKNRTCVA